MKNLLQKLKSIGTAALGVLADLNKPAVATVAAGLLAPVILGLFGDNFSPAVIAPWCGMVGAAALGLQKLLSKPAAQPPAPVTPPAPPAPTPGK